VAIGLLTTSMPTEGSIVVTHNVWLEIGSV
jgi:hypothetical protein